MLIPCSAAFQKQFHKFENPGWLWTKYICDHIGSPTEMGVLLSNAAGALEVVKCFVLNSELYVIIPYMMA